jgi:hypothetical protein
MATHAVLGSFLFIPMCSTEQSPLRILITHKEKARWNDYRLGRIDGLAAAKSPPEGSILPGTDD